MLPGAEGSPPTIGFQHPPLEDDRSDGNSYMPPGPVQVDLSELIEISRKKQIP